jgi:prepilin-type N-terminal cleavage/methylation domain-containing protein
MNMNKMGLTLIELIIVVAIIGILSAVGIPAYIGQQKSAARTEAYTNLQSLRLLEEQFFAENGCYYMTGAPTAVCTNATRTGTAQIQSNASGNAFLRRFQPGAGTLFTYSITTSGATAPASGFIATATGNAGTRVAGDVFTIDSNNNRNF